MTHSQNEAELQARLEARLRQALPLLPVRIRLERYLRLRLGHRVITLDGWEPDSAGMRGRYDVLILINDRPVLIAELKAPGVGIAHDDLQQALSYARNHEPPVPLVLVTDGTTTWLRRTSDGAELQPDDLATDRLAAALSAAAMLATADTQDAIRALLAASPQVWESLLAVWTAENLASKTGAIRDFRYPLANGLIFPRGVVTQLDDLLAKGSRVLVLHGPPLAGVTNALGQLAQRKTAGPVLYLDQSGGSDVLQTIANRLSRELSFGIRKDDVRAWLNSRRGLLNMTLVLDGLPLEGIDELVEYANADILRLVIGTDSETFRKISELPGRSQASLLGRSAVAEELGPLSDDEFWNACGTLDTLLGAVFFPGAQHAPELRWPRRLRVLAATIPAGSPGEQASDRKIRYMLLPVPGLPLLSGCQNAFATGPQFKQDWQLLAATFLEEAERQIADPGWLTAIWGRPSVSPQLAERNLGESRVTRLCDQGYLSWADDQKLGPRLLVRMDELLANYVAKDWEQRLERCSDAPGIKSELTHLLRLAWAVPEGEVALAAAIIRATEQNADVLNEAIPYLWSQEPKVSRLVAGAQFDLLATDATVHIRCDGESDEEVVGNVQPWVVLSHLASVPMGADQANSTVNARIIAHLGASRHLLYQPRPRKLAAVPGFHFHDLPGLGSVLCLQTGIVEPLLQAMLSHAHTFPEEHVGLANHALRKKEVHLAWRLLTVALASEDSTDKQVHRAAVQVKQVLKGWWDAALQEIARRHA